jgi:hypothetical protein
MRLLFREHLAGSFHLFAHPLIDGAADLALEVTAERARDLVRLRTLRVAGALSLDGFATARPCSGSIALKVAREQRIPYDLRFEADDGERYRLFGQRDLSLLLLPRVVDALTTLPVSICDESGKEVGRAVLRFDPKNELGRLLRSIRVKLW